MLKVKGVFAKLLGRPPAADQAQRPRPAAAQRSPQGRADSLDLVLPKVLGQIVIGYCGTLDALLERVEREIRTGDAAQRGARKAFHEALTAFGQAPHADLMRGLLRTSGPEDKADVYKCIGEHWIAEWVRALSPEELIKVAEFQPDALDDATILAQPVALLGCALSMGAEKIEGRIAAVVDRLKNADQIRRSALRAAHGRTIAMAMLEP